MVLVSPFITEGGADLRALELVLQTILFGVVVAAAQVQYIRLAALPNMLATAALAAQLARLEPSQQAAVVAQLPATPGLAAQARSS